MGGKAISATVTPSKQDVAWAAGIFEGEGWSGSNIGKAKAQLGASPQVKVQMTDLEPPERLFRLFGGGFHRKSRDTRAKKPVYCWSASGERARQFLRDIFPYLSPRRQSQAIYTLKVGYKIG